MKTKSLIILLISSALLCILTVWYLSYSSVKILQSVNPFIRVFPPAPIEFSKQIDLKFNSYYFAGYDQGKLYLGNYTAPIHALIIDKNLENTHPVRISVMNDDSRFRSLKLSVFPPNFFLFDGSLPNVYAGSITDWKANIIWNDLPYFTLAEPMDSASFVFRSNKSENGHNVLGSFNFYTENQYQFFDGVLETQNRGDGIFDTDGMLMYGKELSVIVYVYRYRNQYIIAKKSGELILKGRTIDTTEHARLNIVQLHNEKQMAKPPPFVNLESYVFNNFLFVNSALRGKYDNLNAWQDASTIDVYDFMNETYMFSFYIAGIEENKLTDILVTKTHVYVLIDSHLVSYKIRGELETAFQNSIYKQ